MPDHYEKELWDICFIDNYTEFIQSKVDSFAPDVIAIGIRNIQNNDYTSVSTNVEFAKGIVQLLRSLTNKPIVVGGSGFSVIPVELMNQLRPDFGITREGEFSFLQLLEALSTNTNNFDHIKNLCFQWSFRSVLRY